MIGSKSEKSAKVEELGICGGGFDTAMMGRDVPLEGKGDSGGYKGVGLDEDGFGLVSLFGV